MTEGDVRVFVEEAANIIHLPIERREKILKRLEEECISETWQLKSISNEQWVSMGAPIGFVVTLQTCFDKRQLEELKEELKTDMINQAMAQTQPNSRIRRRDTTRQRRRLPKSSSMSKLNLDAGDNKLVDPAELAMRRQNSLKEELTRDIDEILASGQPPVRKMRETLGPRRRSSRSIASLIRDNSGSSPSPRRRLSKSPAGPAGPPRRDYSVDDKNSSPGPRRRLSKSPAGPPRRDGSVDDKNSSSGPRRRLSKSPAGPVGPPRRDGSVDDKNSSPGPRRRLSKSPAGPAGPPRRDGSVDDKNSSPGPLHHRVSRSPDEVRLAAHGIDVGDEEEWMIKGQSTPSPSPLLRKVRSLDASDDTNNLKTPSPNLPRKIRSLDAPDRDKKADISPRIRKRLRNLGDLEDGNKDSNPVALISPRRKRDSIGSRSSKSPARPGSTNIKRLTNSTETLPRQFSKSPKRSSMPTSTGTLPRQFSKSPRRSSTLPCRSSKSPKHSSMTNNSTGPLPRQSSKSPRRTSMPNSTGTRPRRSSKSPVNEKRSSMTSTGARRKRLSKSPEKRHSVIGHDVSDKELDAVERSRLNRERSRRRISKSKSSSLSRSPSARRIIVPLKSADENNSRCRRVVRGTSDDSDNSSVSSRRRRRSLGNSENSGSSTSSRRRRTRSTSFNRSTSGQSKVQARLQTAAPPPQSARRPVLRSRTSLPENALSPSAQRTPSRRKRTSLPENALSPVQHTTTLRTSLPEDSLRPSRGKRTSLPENSLTSPAQRHTPSRRKRTSLPENALSPVQHTPSHRKRTSLPENALSPAQHTLRTSLPEDSSSRPAQRTPTSSLPEESLRPSRRKRTSLPDNALRPTQRERTSLPENDSTMKSRRLARARSRSSLGNLHLEGKSPGRPFSTCRSESPAAMRALIKERELPGAAKFQRARSETHLVRNLPTAPPFQRASSEMHFGRSSAAKLEAAAQFLPSLDHANQRNNISKIPSDDVSILSSRSLEHSSAVKRDPESGRFCYMTRGKIIYEWNQSFDTMVLLVPKPPELPEDDVVCTIKEDSLQLGQKGDKSSFFHRPLGGKCVPESSIWVPYGGAEVKGIIVHLKKANPGEKWKRPLLALTNNTRATETKPPARRGSVPDNFGSPRMHRSTLRDSNTPRSGRPTSMMRQRSSSSRGFEISESENNNTSTPTAVAKSAVVNKGFADHTTPLRANGMVRKTSAHSLDFFAAMHDDDDDDDDDDDQSFFWGSTSSLPSFLPHPAEDADGTQGTKKKDRRRRNKKGTRQKLFQAAYAISPFSLRRKMKRNSVDTTTTDTSGNPAKEQNKDRRLGFRTSVSGRIEVITKGNENEMDLTQNNYQQLDGGDESLFSSQVSSQVSKQRKQEESERESLTNSFSNMLVAAAPLPFDDDDSSVSSLGSKESQKVPVPRHITTPSMTPSKKVLREDLQSPESCSSLPSQAPRSPSRVLSLVGGTRPASPRY